MAIAYVSTNTTKKSANNSSAGQACVDYIRREGKYAPENYKEEGHSNESIVEISQAVPKDWEGKDFRNFAEDGDRLERVNGASFRKMVVAIPREITEEKDRTEYANQWIAHQGLNQFPHLAVLHNQENNPHFHIIFSERNLNFTCPNRQDGSTDLKAFFSRQNPKDPQFGAGDRQMGQQWLKDVKEKNIDLIRTVDGLQNWEPPKGKPEPKIGPAWKNVDPSIREEIQEKVQTIRAEKSQTKEQDFVSTFVKFSENDTSATTENLSSSENDKSETSKSSEFTQKRDEAKKQVEDLQNTLNSSKGEANGQVRAQLTVAKTQLALLEAQMVKEQTRQRQQSDKAAERDAKKMAKDVAKVLEGSPKSSNQSDQHATPSSKSSSQDHTLDNIVARKDALEAQKRQEDLQALKENERHTQSIDRQRDQQAQETQKQQQGMAQETTKQNSMVSAADRADFMNDLKSGMRQIHENGDTSKPLVDLNEGARATYNQFLSMTPEKQDAAILAHKDLKNSPEFSDWKNSHKGNSLANGLSDMAQLAVGDVLEKDQPAVRFTNSADFTKKKKKKPWQL